MRIHSTGSSGGSVVWSSIPTNIIASGGNTLNPTINTNNPGTFFIILTENNCADTARVIINALPSAPQFTVTGDNQCAGSLVSFAVNAPQAGTTYSWDFGDGSSGNGANVSNRYNPAAGNGNVTFNVRVTAINAAGCSTSVIQNLTVKQRPDASIADFTSSRPFTSCGSGSNSFNLVIDNTSSTRSTNALYQINWGDGSPILSSSNLPITGTTHTYTALGYSIITLTVTGQNNCSATRTYSFFKGSNPSVPFSNPGSSVNECVPFSWSVPSVASNNPPGTIYIVSKNDGTSNDTLSHPPPAFYTHTFTNSSCGASGGRTPNTFFVNITALNPCGFSDLTIQPISTSIKPIPSFTISPDTINCVNTNVIFTNNSTAGVAVDNFGVCDRTTKSNWLISPASGWTVTSGSIGFSPPSNNPATWGSSSLGVSFSSAGQYTISLIVGNNCGDDTIVKTVCIQSPPSPSFTASPLSGCSPIVVNFNNTSTPLTQCGNTKNSLFKIASFL